MPFNAEQFRERLEDMCGIIGIIGTAPVAPLLVDGLKRLEYRGYDSAGVATLTNGCIDRRRAEGKLERWCDNLLRDWVWFTSEDFYIESFAPAAALDSRRLRRLRVLTLRLRLRWLAAPQKTSKTCKELGGSIFLTGSTGRLEDGKV